MIAEVNTVTTPEAGEWDVLIGTLIVERDDEAGEFRTDRRVEFNGPITQETFAAFLDIAKEVVG